MIQVSKSLLWCSDFFCMGSNHTRTVWSWVRTCVGSYTELEDHLSFSSLRFWWHKCQSDPFIVPQVPERFCSFLSILAYNFPVPQMGLIPILRVHGFLLCSLHSAVEPHYVFNFSFQFFIYFRFASLNYIYIFFNWSLIC